MLPRLNNFRDLGQVSPLLFNSARLALQPDRPNQPIVRGISSVFRRLRRRRAASLIFFRFLMDGFM